MEAAAREIVRRLHAQGHQALFAGGAVRDRLLGRPAQDFDVATDARPEQVMALFPDHTAVGAHFGVVLVRLAGSQIEVATFRREGAYHDGRRPSEVSYTHDPREDVERRDFTINGLLLDPESGAVIDYVGGRNDLEARRVRAIGAPERRFAEDRLRMLRAVRFAAALDFTLDPATFAAIAAQADRITEISVERVRDEFVKMLTGGRARRSFELLEATGLLRVILPEVAAMKGVAQPPEYHPEGDVWTHTLMMLQGLPAHASAALALGVLLHDVGKPSTYRVAPDRIRFDRHAVVGARMAADICARLKLPLDVTAHVVALVEDHMKFPEVPHMRESTLKRFLRRPGIEDHLTLHELDCRMSHGDLSLYHLVQRRLAAASPDDLAPPRLLTGDDLIALGYPPGPDFRRMLSAVEDAQLEGRLGTADEARAYVQQAFPRPRTAPPGHHPSADR